MSTQNATGAAFRAALTRFESTLTAKERVDMEVSSLADVMASIRTIQLQQGFDKKLQNLNRIKPFIEGMKQYEELVKVFLNVSTMVAFVWVSKGVVNADEEGEPYGGEIRHMGLADCFSGTLLGTVEIPPHGKPLTPSGIRRSGKHTKGRKLTMPMLER
jgi:hypothetical protein